MTVTEHGKLQVGIFFGGSSREREVSFAGGRTVYDNLDSSIFNPLPIFVDSQSRFILLDWKYIYKGSIRDFFPPPQHVPATKYSSSIYVESLRNLTETQWTILAKEVGTPLYPHQFKTLFDVAFLALHGPSGEDGSIQGLLEWYGIPYTGCGIFSSALAIDKVTQRPLMKVYGFPCPRSYSITLDEWNAAQISRMHAHVRKQVGSHFVVKPARQGSSIGVSVLRDPGEEEFSNAVSRAFFVKEVSSEEWQSLSSEEKYKFIGNLVDVRLGVGLPLLATKDQHSFHTIHMPDELFELFEYLDGGTAILRPWSAETVVLVEEFIHGKEFSCIVISDSNGGPIALPPTEICKKEAMYDYRAKYLPGLSRKVTPINVRTESIRAIQRACCSLYEKLQFEVYARLDGFLTSQGQVFLNDPNTTSGMNPSSFFFHQAAEVGLNPSQFLTLIVRSSLRARARIGNATKVEGLITRLDGTMKNLRNTVSGRKRVAVLMGGYTAERHISIESGRNIFEKLASSDKYDPIPVFLTQDNGQLRLFHIPVNFMLKDNADDIREKIFSTQEKNEVVESTIAASSALTAQFAGHVLFEPMEHSFSSLAKVLDVVFIALHGRPGEDGVVQRELDMVGLPYNGSRSTSAALTIDKYETNKVLRGEAFSVAMHEKVRKRDWQNDSQAVANRIMQKFEVPLIAKPVDDGCSSAVLRIENRNSFEAYARSIFRSNEEVALEDRETLGLSNTASIPRKDEFLVEELITKMDADRFLEITGGMMTSFDEAGKIVFYTFEPSEVHAGSGVLSLEEKFLAGEGKNTTPARFAEDEGLSKKLSRQVQKDLEKAAKVLGVEGYCRIDAFVRIRGESAETIIIEVNSLPGMTPATAIFHQTALFGLRPYEFIDRLLEFGMSRNRKSSATK